MQKCTNANKFDLNEISSSNGCSPLILPQPLSAAQRSLTPANYLITIPSLKGALAPALEKMARASGRGRAQVGSVVNALKGLFAQGHRCPPASAPRRLGAQGARRIPRCC